MSARTLGMKMIFMLALMSTTGLTIGQSIHNGEVPLSSGSNCVDITTSKYHGLQHEVKEARLYIEAFIGEDFSYAFDGAGNDDFQIDVSLEIEAASDLTCTQYIQGAFQNNQVQLNLSNESPQEIYSKDFANQFPQIKGFSIHNVSVSSTFGSAITTAGIDADILNDLQIIARYEVEYAVDVENIGGTNEIVEIIPITGTQNNRYVDFDWTVSPSNTNYSYTEFPNYQIQVLKLENLDPTNPNISDPEYIETEIDWEKALSVELETNNTSITMAMPQGSGYYVWRVRPIGTYHAKGIADSRNWGTWNNSSPVQGLQVSLSPTFMTSCISGCAYFYYQDPEEDRNWAYGRVFAEEGKTSESITYADGLGRARQSQTYINSKDERIISQGVPDYSGRAALQTLAVPQPGNLQGFYPSLVLNSQLEPYTADDFDTDNNYQSPGQIYGPIADYYDGTGLEDGTHPIADAEGYPYSRAIFYGDGSERLKEASGIGKTHMIGQITDGSVRTSRTSYMDVTDQELIMVFGDEAPAKESVIKVIQTDPNNVSSVTYINKVGKTIATCLTYNEDEDDNQLLDIVDQRPDPLSIEDQVTLNHQEASGFRSSKRLVFTEAVNDLEVWYEIDNEILNQGCASGNCSYEVVFTIHNLNDASKTIKTDAVLINNVNPGQTITLYPDWSTASNYPTSGYTFDNVNNTLDLPSGEYVIEKQLFPTTDGLDDIDAAITDAQEVLNVYNQIIAYLSSQVTDQQSYDDFLNRIDPLDPFHPDYQDILDVDDDGQPDFTAADFVGFDVDITSQSLPADIEITTPCCGVISVSADLPGGFACDQDVSDWGNFVYNSGNDYDFAGYLTTILGDYMVANTVSFSDLTDGYSEDELNAMMYHMLNDEYYSGQLSFQNGNTYVVESDGSLTLLDPAVHYTPQYTCEELWGCWTALVGSYEVLFANLPSMNSSVSTMVDNEEGSSQPHDDHFDDNLEGSFIVQWLANRALSQEVRNEGPPDLELGLVERFLQCTGYKFGGIYVIDNGSIVHNSVTLMSYDQYDPPSSATLAPPTTPSNLNVYDFTRYFQIGGVNDIHLADRVFAFKYFVYHDDDYQSYNNSLSEVTHCFYPSTTPESPCTPVTCGEGHESWNAAQRYEYYLSLSFNPTVIIEDPNNPMSASCPTQTELDQMEADWESECEGACDLRRDELIEALTQAFTERCYTIGACETDVNNVPERDIEAIADELILQCQSQCDIELECVIENCVTYDGSPVTYANIQPDDNCAGYWHTQASTWDFQLDVPSVCSGINETENLCDIANDPNHPSYVAPGGECDANGNVIEGLQYSPIQQVNVTVSGN